jgi:hypothetical protein
MGGSLSEDVAVQVRRSMVSSGMAWPSPILQNLHFKLLSVHLKLDFQSINLPPVKLTNAENDLEKFHKERIGIMNDPFCYS